MSTAAEPWIPPVQVGPVQVTMTPSGAIDLTTGAAGPDSLPQIVHVPAECWSNVVSAVQQLQAALQRERLRPAAGG